MIPFDSIPCILLSEDQDVFSHIPEVNTISDSDYDPIIGMGPDSRVSDMYAFECELKAIPGNDVDVMTAGVLLKENDFTGDVPKKRIGIHRWTDTFHRPIESGRPGAFAVPPSMLPL